MKKIVSLVMAVLFCGILSVPAFAAGIVVPSDIKQVAADAMGITVDKVTPVEVEKKGNNYEFEVFYNGAGYDFEITENGIIVEFSYDKTIGESVFVIKTGGPYISVEDAKAAAFEIAGVAAKDAKRVEVSFEIDRSVAVFDVDFIANGYEYDVDVDALTSVATVREKEPTGINAGGGIGDIFAKIIAFFTDLFAMIKGWFTR